MESDVKAEDSYRYLKPYRFDIHLQAIDLPDNVTVVFEPPIIKPGGTSHMQVILRDKKIRNTLIKIQGWGGDGTMKDATFYINVLPGIF